MGSRNHQRNVLPAHDYLPRECIDHIPQLYGTQDQTDPTVWIKLFTPDSSWTWFVLEYDREERLAFGLVQGHDEELGYFSLRELEELRGPLGLQVERDLHFTARPLSQCRARTGAEGTSNP